MKKKDILEATEKSLSGKIIAANIQGKSDNRSEYGVVVEVIVDDTIQYVNKRIVVMNEGQESEAAYYLKEEEAKI